MGGMVYVQILTMGGYDPIEKENGWHIQYDHLIKSEDFIWSKEQLNNFNEAFYEDFLVELISGIGIKR